MIRQGFQPEIQGTLERRADGRLEGWAWEPQRPHARLLVEILDGERVVRTVEASRYRSDLARRGIGDGRHGFELDMPVTTAERSGAAQRLIRARVRDDQTVFGQVQEEAAPGNVQRLDFAAAEIARLQAEVADLQAMLAVRRAGNAAGLPLQQMAAMLAVRSWRAPKASADAPSFAAAMAQEELLRRHAGFTLPRQNVDAGVGIVLLAAPEVDHTIAALRSLATAMSGLDVSLVLADDGSDPRTALIHTVARGVAVAPPVGGHACDTLNAAVDGLRCGCVVILRAVALPPSTVALHSLLLALSDAPETALLGTPGGDSLGRWGMANTELPLALPAPLALMLAVRRAHWTEAGALDGALEDGAGLECADLALRLRLLGHDVRDVRTPEAAASAALVAPDARRAWRAATRFRERWGDLGVEIKGVR